MKTTEAIPFVLFGATGDLAGRKVIPALCALFAKKIFPTGSTIIAFSRRPWTDEEYREFIRPLLQTFSKREVSNFLDHVHYAQGTFDNPASFVALKEKIKTEHVFYHLAVQPEFQAQIIEQLGRAALRGKVLTEKPFGQSEGSAAALEKIIEKYFKKEDIFRIDHYLAKPGLLAASAFVAPEGKQIASVTSRILETIDVAGRGEFYDATGALRDVGQSHLLEMLASMLMDKEEAKTSLVQARTHALQQLALSLSHNAQRAQYEGYLDEEGVQKNSQTETYFTATLESSNVRWRGVPLVLEAGKAMREKKSEIEIAFIDGSKDIFAMDLPGMPEAYEALLGAAIVDSHERFVGFEEVLASWKCAGQISTQLQNTPLRLYKRGTL